MVQQTPKIKRAEAKRAQARALRAQADALDLEADVDELDAGDVHRDVKPANLSTLPELSVRLRRSPASIHRDTKIGLPHTRIGDSLRFDVAAVLAWYASPAAADAQAAAARERAAKKKTKPAEVVAIGRAAAR